MASPGHSIPQCFLVPEAPELPLFLWQVLQVHLASGLEALTEAAWSVGTSPEVREAGASPPRSLPEKDDGGWGPSTRKPEQGVALLCDIL